MSSHENIELDLVQPIQMNVYQNNTYRKGLGQLHFNNEPATGIGQTDQHIYFTPKMHSIN